jgi:hypothetical protein
VTNTACPACEGARTVGVARRIVLPGDRRADEIALEILACGCGFKAIAVAEHAKRAALRDEAPERIGYCLPSAAVDLLAHLIERCPEPAEEFCRCPAHATLNRRDLRNQWNLLHSFAPFPGFTVPALAKARVMFSYAPLAWARNGAGWRTALDDREWHLHSVGDRYELAIGEALELELDALPAFWRLQENAQGGREAGRVKEEK